MIENAYENHQTVQGMTIDQVLHTAGVSLHAYTKDVRGKQWASIIELTFAAQHLNIGLDVIMKKKCVHVGQGTSQQSVHLIENHYVLKKGKKARYPMASARMTRGGMSAPASSWDWEDNLADRTPEAQSFPAAVETSEAEVCESKQQEQDSREQVEEREQEPVPTWAWSHDLLGVNLEDAAGVLTIRIGPSIRTDIFMCELMAPVPIAVGALKVRLAEMLGTSKERLIVASSKNTRVSLPDWVETPNDVVVVEDVLIVPLKKLDYISIYKAESKQEFLLPVREGASDHDVLQAVANVVGCLPSQVGLTDQRGMVWTYSMSRKKGSYVVLNVLQRGGMEAYRARSRSRSVSPTLPYRAAAPIHNQEPPSSSSSQDIPHQYRGQLQGQFPLHQQEEGEAQDLQDQPCVNTPPPRTHARPVEESDEDDLGDLTPEAHLWSAVWSETPPPGQPHRVRRPVIVQGQTVGMIHALPNARVSTVLTDIELQITPWSPTIPAPREADTWQQLTSVRIPTPPAVRCYRPLDLRRGVWEFLQRPRLVPVITNGHLTTTLVLPLDIDLMMAHRRIQAAAHVRRYWQLITFEYQSWFVYSLSLPEEVQDMLDELQEHRQRLLRAGMPVGDVVKYYFAHAPWIHFPHH